MVKHISIQQGTPEWHEWRLNHIGGSDAPKIMGESPYGTPYTVWQEKVLKLPPKQATSSMSRGTEREEPIRQWLERQLGISLFPAVLEHDEYSMIGASLDGLTPDGDLPVEIKTSNAIDHAEVKQKRVPRKYYAQVQQALFLVRAPILVLCSEHQDERVFCEVKADKDYQEKLCQNNLAFWKLVEDQEAPPLSSGDIEISNDPYLIERLQRVREIKEALAQYEAEYEAIKGDLVQRTGGRAVKAGDMTLAQVFRKGTIDYKAIPELQKLDLNIYRRKPVQYWTVK